MNFEEFRKARRDARGRAYMIVSPLFLWLAWEVRDDGLLCAAFLTFGVLWGALGILTLYVMYVNWRDRV